MEIENVYKVFSNIKNECCTEISSTLNLKNKLISYINNNDLVSTAASASIIENNLTIDLSHFNLKLECKESLKLYDFPPIVASCIEMHFFFREDDTFHSVLKIFITHDGYIVKNVFSSDYICKTENEYRGKKVFEEIISSLIDKGYIALTPEQQ
ncbi:TPA: hypothetical protein ME601_004200 [Klebsiella pneumoniae]|uniref:hypothetical protein n=1 Tax=Klebsiella/Raoultella group TaxID=2890311 RepID=UPI00103435C4|nr:MULTISPECIES: hypothetical protein [Klebsiella/Raoultella group]DAT42186.1 MAG TPA: hypothetical protein [Caudoviricetes sp.]HBU9773861.1 hypothetical protein [Klebsiella pneumoniae]HCH7884034.1 hypothetical protein [Raoultella ornithinolytica]HBW4601526.1 hypothetical protein [Klebsiella pneumoniae]HBW4866612.1 hypothetical protein [Klebsiella pneumoniae]